MRVHVGSRRTRRVMTTLCATGVLLLVAGCAGEEHGDPATWELRDPGTVTAESQSLDVGVQRLGCSSGVTGEVLEPQVSYQSDRIVVQVDVVPFRGAANCPGNDSVPVTVVLDEPVGDRDLVDGACLSGDAVSTALCEQPVRWPQDG